MAEITRPTEPVVLHSDDDVHSRPDSPAEYLADLGGTEYLAPASSSLNTASSTLLRRQQDVGADDTSHGHSFDDESDEQAVVPGALDQPYRNVIVSGLPRSVDTKQLRAIFSQYGKLITALVMMDVHTGRSRGFGFVWFERAEDARKSLEATNDTILSQSVDSVCSEDYLLSQSQDLVDRQDATSALQRRVGTKRLRVFPSTHADGLSESSTVLLRNWPASQPKDTARPRLAEYGHVVALALSNDVGTRAARGVVDLTVTYTNISDARTAVNNLHGARVLRIDGQEVQLPLPLVTKYVVPETKANRAKAAAAQKAQLRQAAQDARAARRAQQQAQRAAAKKPPPPAYAPHTTPPMPPSSAPQPQLQTFQTVALPSAPAPVQQLLPPHMLLAHPQQQMPMQTVVGTDGRHYVVPLQPQFAAPYVPHHGAMQPALHMVHMPPQPSGFVPPHGHQQQHQHHAVHATPATAPGAPHMVPCLPPTGVAFPPSHVYR